MGHESTSGPLTLVYKTVSTPSPDTDGGPSEILLHVDVYLPNSRLKDAPTSEDSGIGIPAVVYFHGGGLVVGNRRSWFPEWLHSQCFFQFNSFVYPQG